MVDFSKLVSSVLTVAHAVAPLVPYGEGAMKAVDAVRDMIDDTSKVVAADPAAVAELEKGRDAFEAAVLAHADQTADRLADG